MVKIINVNNDPNFNYEEIAKKMRYCEIDDLPCRSLQYDPQFAGPKRAELKSSTVFVKLEIEDEKFTTKQLLEAFEAKGEIVSAKASIDESH